MTSVYEVRDSESGSIDNESENGEVWNATKKYVIGQCSGGVIEVKESIDPYLPRYYTTSVGYWRRKSIAIKGLGNKWFECSGEYTTMMPVGGGGSGDDVNNQQLVPGSVQWDTTGVTEHITNAREEKVLFGDANDSFEGAINVQGTSVQGLDIIVPMLKYSETWIVPSQTAMSDAFVKAVYENTGSTNADQFRAFSPGEALFTGGRGQWNGDQPYATVTFDFQVRANDNSYYVKGLGTTTKKGWEYPWIVYRSDTATSGLMIQRPRCLVLDTIYPSKSWSNMNISAKPGKQVTPTSPQAANAAQVAAFLGGR